MESCEILVSFEVTHILGVYVMIARDARRGDHVFDDVVYGIPHPSTNGAFFSS